MDRVHGWIGCTRTGATLAGDALVLAEYAMILRRFKELGSHALSLL